MAALVRYTGLGSSVLTPALLDATHYPGGVMWGNPRLALGETWWVCLQSMAALQAQSMGTMSPTLQGLGCVTQTLSFTGLPHCLGTHQIAASKNVFPPQLPDWKEHRVRWCALHITHTEGGGCHIWTVGRGSCCIHATVPWPASLITVLTSHT